MVLLPLLVDRTYGLAADWYGYLVAVLITGNLAGMALTGTVNLDGRSRWLGCFLGFGIGGAGFLFIGFAPHLYILVGLLFAIGAGTSVMNILLIAKVQAAVPSTILGRVMAAMGVLAQAVVPVALLLAGVVTDALDQNVLPVFLISGVAALTFSAWLALDRDIRHYLSS